MKIEKTLEKYYYLTGDEKSKVGNASPADNLIEWDFFEKQNAKFELAEPLIFKIDEGRFSGTMGDHQINTCGFMLFSKSLRVIFEKYLTEIDEPKWYPARIIDLGGNTVDYSILHFHSKKDLLDHEKSTFVEGTDHPIKKRYGLDKIGDRLIFSQKSSSSPCVHDVVRKEIKKAGLSGMYFYKIHTAGRLV